jgi:streptomycin 6-kinase
VPAAIPSSLDWLRASEQGRAWLGSLPSKLAGSAERWGLGLSEPYPDSYVSIVVPAKRGSEDLVVKIQFPDLESEAEALALETWNGNGAVRLIDHDQERHALLLERCVPGHHLSTRDADTALDIVVDLLPRLWVPAGDGFRSLATEAERWIDNLPEEWEQAGRPFERALLDAATETLADLAASQGKQVLLHQDLHGHNILAAQREPWLAIDPKPLVGERELGLSPLIRSSELGHSRREVVNRLHRLTDELGVDRNRTRLWAFAHAIAWGFEDGRVLPHSIETACWLFEAT